MFCLPSVEFRKVLAFMNKLFDYANEYIKQCQWQDLALLKFCLASIGVLIGVSLPRKVRVPVFALSIVVFINTYIPLMVKFVRVVLDAHRKEAN